MQPPSKEADWPHSYKDDDINQLSRISRREEDSMFERQYSHVDRPPIGEDSKAANSSSLNEREEHDETGIDDKRHNRYYT